MGETSKHASSKHKRKEHRLAEKALARDGSAEVQLSVPGLNERWRETLGKVARLKKAMLSGFVRPYRSIRPEPRARCFEA